MKQTTKWEWEVKTDENGKQTKQRDKNKKKNQTGAQNGGLADNDFVIVIANFAAVVVFPTVVVAVGVTVAVVVADVR